MPAQGGPARSGATCAVGSGPGVVALITCDYPNGVYLEVQTWARGTGSADSGGLFGNRADSAVPWMFLTLWDTDLDLFAVSADRDGHTGQELQDTWFADAPLLTD